MSSALEKSHSWGVEDVCSQIRSAPSSDAYSAPPAICSMMAHTPFHCESWCLPLLPDPLKSSPPPIRSLPRTSHSANLSPTSHLVKEGELLQSPVLPHGSDGQVFGTTQFHFLLWREIHVVSAFIFVRVSTASTEF